MSKCIIFRRLCIISCHLIKQPHSHMDALLFVTCLHHQLAYKRSMMQRDGLEINSLLKAFMHTCGAFAQEHSVVFVKNEWCKMAVEILKRKVKKVPLSRFESVVVLERHFNCCCLMLLYILVVWDIRHGIVTWTYFYLLLYFQMVL